MRTRFVVPMLGTFLLALPAGAQSPSPAPSSAAQQSLAATLNVYVFGGLLPVGREQHGQ